MLAIHAGEAGDRKIQISQKTAKRRFRVPVYVCCAAVPSTDGRVCVCDGDLLGAPATRTRIDPTSWCLR